MNTMENSAPPQGVSKQTAKVLVDNFLADELRKANSSSSGALSVGGRSVIAAVGLGAAALLGGLIATSTVVGTPAILAGIGAVTTGLVGAHSAVTAYVLKKVEPTLNEYKKFEAGLLNKPEVKEELTQEVMKELNAGHSVDFMKVIESVGQRHGLFENGNAASWVERSQSNATPSISLGAR